MRPRPDGSDGTDPAIQTAKFPSGFTTDLPASTSALLGASLRPISAAASVASSHVVMISHPDLVTKVIKSAATATS